MNAHTNESSETDDKFAAFVRGLAAALASPSDAAEALTALIGSIGLFRDDRGIYGEHERLQLPEGRGGMWQNPRELAKALLAFPAERLAAEVRAAGRDAATFVEVGTFTGATFFVVRETLRARLGEFGVGIEARTYDPADFVQGDLRAHVEADLRRGTSEQAAADRPEGGWDIAFIDGCHEAPWPALDWERLAAKVTLFHDVEDRHCPDVRALFASIRADSGDARETHVVNEVPGFFGIGTVCSFSNLRGI